MSSSLLSSMASDAVRGLSSTRGHKSPLSPGAPCPGLAERGRHRAWAPTRGPYPHPPPPSPVQIIARRPRGAPGGGEGVLGQLGETEPRRGLSRPRAFLPLAGGRQGHGLRSRHGWGTRRDAVRDAHQKPRQNPARPTGAEAGEKPARPRPLREQRNLIPPLAKNGLTQLLLGAPRPH